MYIICNELQVNPENDSFSISYLWRLLIPKQSYNINNRYIVNKGGGLWFYTPEITKDLRALRI
jgi:hypothetical protein